MTTLQDDLRHVKAQLKMAQILGLEKQIARLKSEQRTLTTLIANNRVKRTRPARCRR